MCRILVRQRPPAGAPRAFPDVVGPLRAACAEGGSGGSGGDLGLEALARVRRARDRLDRDPERPLDVVALAREVGLAPGCLSRLFQQAYGARPDTYVAARRRPRVADHAGG